MVGVAQEFLHYSEPFKVSSWLKKTLAAIMSRAEKKEQFLPPQEFKLSFEGFNPVLAKQLSEVETQLGHLAQVQFEMIEERRRMHAEMRALKSLVQADAG